MKLFEDRTATIIRPTEAQKTVLCMIKASATPELAAAEISNGQHMVTARDMLAKMGLITIDDNQAALTPKGEEIMRNQNLTDEGGDLTSEGEKYAYTEQHPKTESILKQTNAKLNEEAKPGDITKLDFFSGEDKAKGLDIIQKAGLKHKAVGPVVLVMTPRDSLKAAMLLSHLRKEKVKFDDKSE